jgi:lipopolysaccharide transport system permease protein
VGFSSDVIPDSWRLLYSLNPMVGVIDGFRWAILGGQIELYVNGLACSVLLAIALFASGLLFFLRTERKFADVI